MSLFFDILSILFPCADHPEEDIGRQGQNWEDKETDRCSHPNPCPSQPDLIGQSSKEVGGLHRPPFCQYVDNDEI